LLGETDLHGMTVGYKTHTIYVINSGQNLKMATPGMYYSTDETKTWIQSKANGLTESPFAMAAHPTEEGTIVIGTKNGIFLSRDYGNRFEKIITELQITSLAFNQAGQLWVGGVNEKPFLFLFDLNSLDQQEAPIPTLTEDAIAYIAQNPANDKEIVFATFNKDIYISSDGGEHWSAIAEKGTGSPLKNKNLQLMKAGYN
jgi:photosystem II stability/assembly factor-like uncharacterized protein